MHVHIFPAKEPSMKNTIKALAVIALLRHSRRDVRLGMRGFQRDFDAKFRSLPESTLHADRAAVRLRNPPCDGKPQARASRGARASLIRAIETLKNMRQIVWSDSHAGILHRGDGVAISAMRAKTKPRPPRACISPRCPGGSAASAAVPRHRQQPPGQPPGNPPQMNLFRLRQRTGLLGGFAGHVAQV